jgi:long-chain acyl-CoA synthetase
LVKFENAIKEGRENKEEVKFDNVTGDTLYTFSYTSGTTGMPKGVMLSHRNFVCNIGAMTKFDPNFYINDRDVYLSYLPLAHVIERCLLLCALSYKM